MPLKHLLHLDDQSGASQPDGCAAELRSCSIYLGLSLHRSVSCLWNGIAAYSVLGELLATTGSVAYWPTSRALSATLSIRLDY